MQGALPGGGARGLSGPPGPLALAAGTRPLARQARAAAGGREERGRAAACPGRPVPNGVGARPGSARRRRAGRTRDAARQGQGRLPRCVAAAASGWRMARPGLAGAGPTAVEVHLAARRSGARRGCRLRLARGSFAVPQRGIRNGDPENKPLFSDSKRLQSDCSVFLLLGSPFPDPHVGLLSRGETLGLDTPARGKFPRRETLALRSFEAELLRHALGIGRLRPSEVRHYSFKTLVPESVK